MQTVAGLFTSLEQAEKAVRSLKDAGCDEKNISLLARQPQTGQPPDDGVERVDVKDVDALEAGMSEADVREKSGAGDLASGAGTGAVLGGAAGGLLGLLAGLGAVMIPGIGPAVAAGTMAAALGLTAGGAGVGAAVGGILGAMTALSIPEDEANLYAEAVRRGASLVAVQVEDEHAQHTRDILKTNGALDIEVVRDRLKRSGWEYFDENAVPDWNTSLVWDPPDERR